MGLYVNSGRFEKMKFCDKRFVMMMVEVVTVRTVMKVEFIVMVVRMMVMVMVEVVMVVVGGWK